MKLLISITTYQRNMAVMILHINSCIIRYTTHGKSQAWDYEMHTSHWASSSTQIGREEWLRLDFNDKNVRLPRAGPEEVDKRTSGLVEEPEGAYR